MLYTEWHEEQLSVARSLDGPALIVQNARRNQRPFLHPIVAPDGLGTLTEDAPPHHPWQQGCSQYSGAAQLSCCDAAGYSPVLLSPENPMSCKRQR
jgi:hypothetical protein